MEDKINNEITSKLSSINTYLGHHKGASRTQDNILRLLGTNTQLSQKDLQNMLNIKSGSISEVLGKLEKQGFVERNKTSEDARSKQLSLTELGKKRLTNIKRKGEKDIYYSLSDDEKKELLLLLNKICDYLHI